uniref:Uncharacterized protein n=1 Tax=Oryza barthii TaxID=65489 RepID=A0A0D3GEB8_9ORYZ
MAKKQSLLLAMMLVVAGLAVSAMADRKLMSLVKPQPNQLTYHNGAVLSGDIPVSILWYGRFTPAQKAVVTDFVLSLAAPLQAAPAPSVSQWWGTMAERVTKALMRPLLCYIIVVAVAPAGCAAFNPRMLFLVKPDPIVLKDHHGVVLSGNVTVNVLYYGRFTPAQRAVVADFVRSASAAQHPRVPSVAAWWSTTSLYRGGGARLRLGMQVMDERMSLGRSLSSGQRHGAGEGGGAPPRRRHGGAPRRPTSSARYAYLWAGNPAQQCPGQCAWPFHQPVYGPQAPPLVPPNGDVGVDGMVISLAALLAGTVTNPFGDGYYQGDAGAGMEAATACAGVFGSGAFPGYPGKLLKDPVTGASYNAVGLAGRKYLLPALWDPTTSQCKTLV